jgi:hypothetical protein
MENIGGVIFFAVVVVMFGVTAYLYLYGDDLNLKFWGSGEDEIPPVNDSATQPGDDEQNQGVNETDLNASDVNDTLGNSTLGSQTLNLTGDEVNSTYLHWNHTTITYKILNKGGCWVNPIQDFEEAISMIEDGARGAIDFLEVQSGDYDIEVRCVNKTGFLDYLENTTKPTCENFTIDLYKGDFDPVIEGYIDDEDYYVNHRVNFQTETNSSFQYCYYDTSEQSAGNYSWEWLFESRPVVENGVIMSHKISIFDEAANKRCSTIPTREIHELLHGLGFEHVETPPYYQGYGWSPADFYLLEDVMFEYRYCVFQKKIQEKYFDCLQKIYLGADKECEDVYFLEES